MLLYSMIRDIYASKEKKIKKDWTEVYGVWLDDPRVSGKYEIGELFATFKTKEEAIKCADLIIDYNLLQSARGAMSVFEGFVKVLPITCMDGLLIDKKKTRKKKRKGEDK